MHFRKAVMFWNHFLANVLIKMHCIMPLLDFKQFNSKKLLIEENWRFLQKKDKIYS